MRPYLISSLILSLSAAGVFAQEGQKPQKRVSPDAYTAAPAKVRAELKKRHCELPETSHWERTRLNIVSGHFGDPSQTDWAAICIAPDGATRVLVFWGKSGPCPAEIHHGWALESHFPPGEAGSLYLLAQSREQILEYRKFFGDPQNNAVAHEGIEVGGDEASLIYYCYDGKWLELQGND